MGEGNQKSSNVVYECPLTWVCIATRKWFWRSILLVGPINEENKPENQWLMLGLTKLATFHWICKEIRNLKNYLRNWFFTKFNHSSHIKMAISNINWLQHVVASHHKSTLNYVVSALKWLRGFWHFKGHWQCPKILANPLC